MGKRARLIYYAFAYVCRLRKARYIYDIKKIDIKIMIKFTILAECNLKYISYMDLLKKTER